MSTKFYVSVILLLTIFGGFMVWLHGKEIKLLDERAQCVARAGWL